jgi:hypothetical protein
LIGRTADWQLALAARLLNVKICAVSVNMAAEGQTIRR